MLPTLASGGAISTLGLGAGPTIGLTLGAEALISGTSDTTSDPGNLGSFAESQIQKVAPGFNIPWATRDGDSPDFIYWSNFAENMFTAGAFEVLPHLPTILKHGKAGNTIIPKDEVAQTLVDAIPEKPATLQDAILRNQAKKKAEQLKIGQRVLDAP